MGKVFVGMEPLTENYNVTKKTLKDLVAPFLNPSEYCPEEVKKCKKFLKMLVRKKQLGRQKLCTALMSMGIEPYDARETELFRVVPRLLPLRTQKDAWRIVADNQGLLFMVTNFACGKYGFDGEREKDAKNEITIAMFWAAMFWDEKKARFSTFFMESSKESHRKLNTISGMIRFPPTMNDKIMRYRSIRAKHPNISRDEIADMMDVTQKVLERIERASQILKSSKRPVSDDVFFYLTHFSEQKADGWRRSDFEKLECSILSALGTLSEREREILKKRFGFGNRNWEGMTLKALGKELGYSRERIRQIQEKGLGKLKHPRRLKALKAYL